MVVFAALLAITPLYFRMIQCIRMVYEVATPGQYIYWPHSFNTLKYLLGMVVVIMTLSYPVAEVVGTNITLAFKVILGMMLVMTTLYQTFWDVYCDWGLCTIVPSWAEGWLPHLPKKAFLRKKLMYHRYHLYYVAIVVDLVLRFAWTLSLLPQNLSASTAYTLSFQLTPFLAAAEQCRRCMWGLIRIEWEHVRRAVPKRVVRR